MGLGRAYPQVANVQDPATQQSLRMGFDKSADLEEKLTALQATVTSLQASISALQATVATLSKTSKQNQLSISTS